jgi:hypothetical protein
MYKKGHAIKNTIVAIGAKTTTNAVFKTKWINASIMPQTSKAELEGRKEFNGEGSAGRRQVGRGGTLVHSSSTSPVTPASEVAQIGATLPSRTTFWRRPPAHFSPPL